MRIPNAVHWLHKEHWPVTVSWQDETRQVWFCDWACVHELISSNQIVNCDLPSFIMLYKTISKKNTFQRNIKASCNRNWLCLWPTQMYHASLVCVIFKFVSKWWTSLDWSGVTANPGFVLVSSCGCIGCIQIAMFYLTLIFLNNTNHYFLILLDLGDPTWPHHHGQIHNNRVSV